MLTENYIAIPLRLATDLRDNPVAIGVYALIARLYLIVQAPISLSRTDIQRYDPLLKEGTVKRALDRLTAAGWLTEAPGNKRRYMPTWGRSRAGAPRPWQIGPRLGCPTHVFTTRLDRAILDTYIGKLTPHSRLSAAVERYLSAPLLSLRDVGAYVLTLAGQPLAATGALYRWNLVSDGQAQPIPDDDQILALASQQQQADAAAPQLLPAGWARLGLPLGQPMQSGRPQPLFFAPKALIGHLIPAQIGDSIGGSPMGKAASFPSECEIPGPGTSTMTMPGKQSITREKRESTTSKPQAEPGGGGTVPEREKKSLPDTAAAKLLVSIHAHPASVRELATTPAIVVEEAIAYAESEPGIESVAGWVIDALRRHRDEHWPIPQVRRKRRGECIDAQALMSGDYSDLFRLGSDLSDVDRSMPALAAQASCPGALAPVRGDPQPPAQGWSPEELTRLVRDELVIRCERSYHKVVRRLQIQATSDRTIVWCASPAERIVVMSTMLGILRWIVADLGLPAHIYVTDGAPRYTMGSNSTGAGRHPRPGE